MQYLHDLITDRLFFSVGVGNFYGKPIPADGILFSEWEALLPEQVREKLYLAIEIIKKGQTVRMEYEYPIEQGKQCWVQHYIEPILSSDGQVRTALACLLIGDNPEFLDPKQLLPNQILDAMIESVIVTDLQGIIQYWNPAAEDLYGYRASEVIGQPIYQVTVSEQTQKEAYIIMELLRAGRSWSGEFMVKDRNGQSFLAHVTDTPLFDRHGNLNGIIGISHNASRKASLLRNTNFMADMMRQLHVPVFITDDAMQIKEWNWALREVSGWREMEMVDLPMNEIIFFDGLKELFQRILQTKNPQKVFETQALLSKKSGDPVPVRLRASRVFDEGFTPLGVLWSVYVVEK